MEENNKEEVLEEKKENSKPEEFKQVKRKGKHSKLSPVATVLLTIVAALGLIVLGTAAYALIIAIK